MPNLGLGLFIGIGGQPTASAPGGFDTDFDTEANIRASTGAVVGQVAFGTDTYDLYVYDGSHWRKFEND